MDAERRAVFYGLFFLSLYIYPEISRYLFVSFGIVALAIIGLLFRPENVPGRFYTNAIIREFAAGMWICYFVRRITIPACLLNVSMIGALSLASFGLSLAAESLWPTALRFVALGLPAVSLVTAAVLLEANGISSRTDFAVEQGDSSDALYLTHFLSYQVCEKVLFEFFDLQNFYLRTVVLAGLVAWIVYRRIEVPLTQSVRGLFNGLERPSHARPWIFSGIFNVILVI